MATLTGNLADVTNKAPDNISSITVKAPAARIGGGSGSSVIVSSPATVDFNSSTGEVTISNLTGGLSWLYIEGDGWADSIALAVADGMATLVEAVANALGAPGIADYIRLLADLENRINDVAQDAVDAAAENIKWVKRALTTGEDLNTVITPGLYVAQTFSTASSLVNRPDVTGAVDRSAVEVLESGGGAVQQTWYPMGAASKTDMPVMRRRRDNAGVWTEWERINAFTPAKESSIMQSISHAKWEQGALSENTNLNELSKPGVYHVSSSATAKTIINAPNDPSAQTVAAVTVKGSGAALEQVWATIHKSGRFDFPVYRRVRAVDGTWTPWTRQDTPAWRSLNSGEDILSLVPGKYSISSQTIAETIESRPADTAAWGPGRVEVFLGAGDKKIIQWESQQPANSGRSGIWRRQQDNSGAWSEWRRVDNPQVVLLGLGANLTTLGVGSYRVETQAVAESIGARPADTEAWGPSLVTVKTGARGNKFLTWESMQPATSGRSGVWRRQQDSGGAWSEWRRVDNPQTVLLGLNVDVFNLHTGTFIVNTHTIAVSLLNKPADTAAWGQALITVRTGVRGNKIITWEGQQPATSNLSGIWQTQQDTAGNWAPWRRIDEPSAWDAVNDRTGDIADALYSLRKGMTANLMNLHDATAPVWGWVAPPGQELTIPTHEGSGEATHPSVLYFANGWNGYKYWMAHTPYPGGDEAHEDPNIVVSDDGENWQVPEGLTNPIADAPGKPGPHNSDTQLVMGPDGAMWMTYRMVDRPNGDLTRIFEVRSTNGVDWSDPVEIWTAKPGTSEAGFLSQALVWTGTTWRLYGIRNAVSGKNRLAYYETTDENPTAASSWALVDCSIPGAGYGRNFWHVDVLIYDGEYLGIMQDMSRVGLDGDIYFMRSADGQTWERSMTPLVDKIGNRHTAIYKTGFVPSGSGASLTLDLFYPGWVITPAQRWGIFRTTATLANR